MAFAAGMLIGKYELGKKLGEGGFGLVMIARDTNLVRRRRDPDERARRQARLREVATLS